MAKSSRISIIINAKNRAAGAFSSAIRGVNKLGAALQRAAKWGVLLGSAAIGATLLKATAAAAKFGSTMAEVSTLVDTSIVSMDRLRKGVLEMTNSMPQTADELGAGLYQVISAGVQSTANQMFVLQEAAKAATGGLTDTFTAVDAGTTALNAWGLEASEITRVNDVFFTVIKEGKLTFEGIASTIGTFATSASLAGVSLEETGAAMATMTKFGVPAQEAASSLNRLLITLVNQTGEQEAAFAKLGVGFNTATIAEKGFAGILQELNKLTGENIDELAELFPNIRAARSAFVLAGKGNAEFNRILGETLNSTGAANVAFEKMANDAKNQFKLFRNKVNVVLIEMGEIIIKSMLPAMKKGGSAIQKFGKFIKENEERFSEIGSAIGKMVAGAIVLLPKVFAAFFNISSVIKTVGEDLKVRLAPAWLVFQEAVRASIAVWEVFRTPLLQTLAILRDISAFLIFLAVNTIAFVIRQLVDFKFGWERIWLEIAAIIITFPLIFKKAMSKVLFVLADVMATAQTFLSRLGIDIGEGLIDATFKAALVMGAKANRELAAFNAGLVAQREELQANRDELIALILTGEGFKLRPPARTEVPDEEVAGGGGELRPGEDTRDPSGVETAEEALEKARPVFAAFAQTLRDMWAAGDEGSKKFGRGLAAITLMFAEDFTSAINDAFEAFVSGSGNAAKAFAAGMLKAISNVAKAQAKLMLAKAAGALGEGLLGNPAAFAAAAKFFAAAAAFSALAGAIGGAAGGGGGGAGGVGDRSSGIGGADEKGTLIFKIEGGFLDMSDPRQEEAMRNALGDISGRRVVVEQ